LQFRFLLNLHYILTFDLTKITFMILIKIFNTLGFSTQIFIMFLEYIITKITNLKFITNDKLLGLKWIIKDM
jgi:hypothetical protein